jgi:dienelactone hydrolase
MISVAVLTAAAACALSCNSIDRAAVKRVYFDSAAGGKPVSLPDPGLSGSFAVKSFLYAGGRNPRRAEYARDKVGIVTRPVDISAFFDSDPTVFGLFLDGSAYYDRVNAPHWGFDERSVPLNGKVWYPDARGPFPLVVCVHGNHDPYESSEFGYDWLGRLLASRGYVFASIDENFLNGRTDGRENDARAILLLEHARAILSWNADPGSPLAGKLDGENVALIGHSRGGEAAATAAIFNRLSAYPDDARVRFDYGLPIKAVVSLAPVEGQYRPARRALPVPDVNYLVLQGSADGDVDGDFGLRFVNRGAPAAGTFRAGIWIYGANHAQFNSDWAKRQDPQLTLRANLITVEEQQKIAGTAISAFLEASFGREPGYRELFKDWRTGHAWLPPTLILSQYREAGAKPVADYEEDGDPATASAEGWIISARGFSAWSEQPVSLDSGTFLLRPRMRQSALQTMNVESWAVRLQWEKGEPAVYSLHTSGEGRAGNILSFDLAALDLPGEDALLDFTIETVSVSGDVGRYRFGDLYALTRVPATWVGYKGYSRPEILSSFIVPLADDLSIKEIRFRFDGTERGAVLLDNVEIKKEAAQ